MRADTNNKLGILNGYVHTVKQQDFYYCIRDPGIYPDHLDVNFGGD